MGEKILMKNIHSIDAAKKKCEKNSFFWHQVVYWSMLFGYCVSCVSKWIQLQIQPISQIEHSLWIVFSATLTPNQLKAMPMGRGFWLRRTPHERLTKWTDFKWKEANECANWYWKSRSFSLHRLINERHNCKCSGHLFVLQTNFSFFHCLLTIFSSHTLNICHRAHSISCWLAFFRRTSCWRWFHFSCAAAILNKRARVYPSTKWKTKHKTRNEKKFERSEKRRRCKTNTKKS